MKIQDVLNNGRRHSRKLIRKLCYRLCVLPSTKKLVMYIMLYIVNQDGRSVCGIMTILGFDFHKRKPFV